MSHLRHSLRSLRLNPILSTITVLGLALGIDSVLQRSPSYRKAASTIALWEQQFKQSSMERPALSADLLDSRSQPKSVDNASEFCRQPTTGKTLPDRAEKAGQDDEVMISHGLWQRRFASDPAMVGAESESNSKLCTVIWSIALHFASQSGARWIPIR